MSLDMRTCIRHGGSMDGTEIMGILLTKKLPFSVGEFVMFVNLFIFAWAGCYNLYEHGYKSNKDAEVPDNTKYDPQYK